MKQQFEKRDIACLQCLQSQVQNLEQTQEVRLPEGIPGAARVLGAWGQPVLRSKEWQRDSLVLSGGIMAWVLYEPEDGTSPKEMNTWIPFKMELDLPDGSPEGKARIRMLLRGVDARITSAGKLLVRAGIGILAECWADHSVEISTPGEVSSDVELLTRRWPVRLPKETGEKPFSVEEELTLPQSLPQVEELLYYRMEPEVTDRKVLGNKIVFRGSGNLHILYRCEDNGIHSWDFELPFSQYAELTGSYSADGQADVMMAVTQMELEPNGEGGLKLRAGFTGQYLVNDLELLETVEDAYSPYRELTVRQDALRLPVLLESRRENIYGEQLLPIQADVVADISFLPDYPRQSRVTDTVTLEQPAMIQILYYDGDGKLQGTSQRWLGSLSLKAGEDTSMMAQPLQAQLQILSGNDSVQLRSEVPLQLTSTAADSLAMVTELELGEQRVPDPQRPSLILRRPGSDRLWEIARQSHSTVNAIRQANGLEGEPDPKRMLLIPVM